MMHRYDTCIGYDMYPICRYVYFQNNKNIEKCIIILKNIINI